MSGKRIAVVTGGASGIGEATALKLAAAGDKVFVADVNREAAEGVAARITAAGGLALAETLDVADDAAIAEVFGRIAKDHGAIDVLVNSAGLVQNAETVINMDMEQNDRIWAVNYRGTLQCSRVAGRQMKEKQGGSIIMIGSINSYRPMPLAAYNPGKVAIKGLMEVMAAELGPHKVRVNGVAPGYTMTPAIKSRIDSGKRDPQAILDMQALDYFIQPEDIADGIHFLCSDAAKAITGVLLPIDSGWLVATTYNTYPAMPDA